MKADPAAQALLIDLQALDSRLAEIDRTRANPPQAQRLRELGAQFQAVGDEARAALGELEDTQAQIARVEEDVRVVVARQDQDRTRLESSSNPREIQSIEAELSSLARRRDALEATQLELMEQEETQARRSEEAKERREGIRLEGQSLQAARKDAETVLLREHAAAESSRAALAARVPEDLLGLYDRVRSRGIGIGAARLSGRVCGGCGIQLGPSDFAAVQKLSVADICQCPQCDAILVRGEQ